MHSSLILVEAMIKMKTHSFSHTLNFGWVTDELFSFLKVMLTLSLISLACCCTYLKPYIFECKT
jgi:hypothetical protein